MIGFFKRFLFGSTKSDIPVIDGLQSLTIFLKGYGFELISSGNSGEGRTAGHMQEYSSDDCNLIFFFANETFYFGTNTFSIADTTKGRRVKKQEWITLSYYINEFVPQFNQGKEKGLNQSDSLVQAFGDKLSDAIKLFIHVRRQGRITPLRLDRTEALEKPNKHSHDQPA